MPIPKVVLAAQQVDFGCSISGYLCCAHLVFPCLVGIVYADITNRFKDGTRMRTSVLVHAAEVQDYVFVETLNGSRYVVCHWLDSDVTAEAAGVVH
jgi:general stress protein CsbA